MDTVMDGLEADVIQTASKDKDYYTNLYLKGLLTSMNIPEDESDKRYLALAAERFSEFELARYVEEYPDIHPQMAALVLKIAKAIETNLVFDLWINDETQAGNALSFALAMHDKQYCSVYAQSLLQQDLDHHEVNHCREVKEMLEEWGPCKEMGDVLAARIENIGQHGGELMDELLEEDEDGDLAVLLKDYVPLLIEKEVEHAYSLAASVAKKNKNDVSLLTYCVNYCDPDIVDFDGLGIELVEVWAVWGFCPEISDLVASFLLREEYGISVFDSSISLEQSSPAFSEAMQDENNSNMFLASLCNWLNSEVPTAEELREKLHADEDEYVEIALAKAFEIIFKLEETQAQSSAGKYLALYKDGKTPTRSQI